MTVNSVSPIGGALLAASVAVVALGLALHASPTFAQTAPSLAPAVVAAQGEGGPFNAIEIANVPVAVSVFPGEIYRAPRSWGEQSFKKLIYWNEVEKGGHFAAWEQPEIFVSEIRSAFRPLRASQRANNGAVLPRESGK